MPRIAVAAIVVALAAAITWRYPLFHVVSLKQFTENWESGAFDAEKFAERFWDEKLTPAFSSASLAVDVVAAFKVDPSKARKEYGRSVGISRSSLLFVQGRGRVTAVEESRVGVSLGDDAPVAGAEPDLWLNTGPIFGNAARDSTGLLSSKDFSDSQHFNNLAKALNAIVEDRVASPLHKDAAPGKAISFTACVEVPGGRVKLPLEFIPLEAAVEKRAE